MRTEPERDAGIVEPAAPTFPHSLRFGAEIAWGPAFEVTPIALGWAPVWPLELRVRASYEHRSADPEEGRPSRHGVSATGGSRLHQYVPARRVGVGRILESALGWAGAWGSDAERSGPFAHGAVGLTFGGVTPGRRGTHFNASVRLRRSLVEGGPSFDPFLVMGLDYEIGPHPIL